MKERGLFHMLQGVVSVNQSYAVDVDVDHCQVWSTGSSQRYVTLQVINI